MSAPWPTDCDELVELVTEYLEHALPDTDVERLEHHLALCDGCEAYLDQMRTTIALSGRLGTTDVPEEALAPLLHVFRDFRLGPPA